MAKLPIIEEFLSQKTASHEVVAELNGLLKISTLKNPAVRFDVKDEINLWINLSDDEKLTVYLDLVDKYIPKNDASNQTQAIFNFLTALNPIPLSILVTQIFPKLDDYSYKSLILGAWLAVPQHQKDAAIIIKALIGNIVENKPIHLHEYNVDIQTLLAIPKTDQDKAILIAGLIINPANDLPEATLRQIYPLFKGSLVEIESLVGWASKPSDGPTRLVKVISLMREQDPESQSKQTRVLNAWAAHPENTIGASTVEKILPTLKSEYDKAVLIEVWLIKNGKGSASQAFIKFVSTLQNPDYKSRLTSVFLNEGLYVQNTEDTATFNLSFEDFNTILNFSNDAEKKTRWIRQWLKDTKNIVTHHQIIQLLAFIPEDFSDDKNIIFNDWMRDPNSDPTLEDYAKLLSMPKYKPYDYDKMEFIILMINQNKLSFNTLVAILKKFDDTYYKDMVVDAWIKKVKPTEARLQKFIDLIHGNSYVSPYDLKAIFNAFERVGFNNEQLPALCKHLYPQSEMAQVDIFYEAVESKKITGPNLLTHIKEFALSLQDDDQCFVILKQGIAHGLKPVDVLMVAKNRLSSKFSSLTNLLNIPLKDALTDEGYSAVAELFKDLPENVKLSDLKLSDLFSYYDINKDMLSFRSKLKPGILEGFNEKFEPTNKEAFISSDEHDKLTALNITPLPRLVDLCHYLKSNLIPVPPFGESVEKLDALIKSMGDSAPKSREQQYKTLLEKGDAVTSDDVLEFFKKITGIDISKNEGDKFLKLFQERKTELTYLFSQKGGALDYIAVIADIGDGCVANVGTKTTIYLYGKLLNTPEARILYPFYCESIAVPILQPRGRDPLGSSTEGANPLSAPDILTSYVSPPGFFLGLSHHIFASDVNPKKIIKKLASAEEWDEYDFNIIDITDKEKVLKVQSKIAAYLIIRETMPEVFSHSSLNSLKKECEHFLKEQDNSNTLKADLT